jgi:acyl-CoA synthetase (AMP-forming)/AMP-acid ligase II
MAFVVLKKGEYLTGEELQHFCSQYLADYKIPKYIRFIDELPKNSLGKVIKHRLLKIVERLGYWHIGAVKEEVNKRFGNLIQEACF